MEFGQRIYLEWLGQNGFLLHLPNRVIACDLYLSDYCQKKSKLDHTRLMPIPVKPEKLDFIDDYLITHDHIDHFDPETIGQIMQSNNETTFWCPPACQNVINENFHPDKKRFILASSYEKYALSKRVSLIALPAAHEKIEKDNSGEYVFFSYLLFLAEHKKAVFFAGDTIPYPNHDEIIKQYIPSDYALTMVLPVNGRDTARAELGFKGNLTLKEAVELANRCDAKNLVPCHFGMFALNDLPEDIELKLFDDFKGKTIIPQICSRYAI